MSTRQQTPINEGQHRSKTLFTLVTSCIVGLALVSSVGGLFPILSENNDNEAQASDDSLHNNRASNSDLHVKRARSFEQQSLHSKRGEKKTDEHINNDYIAFIHPGRTGTPRNAAATSFVKAINEFRNQQPAENGQPPPGILPPRRKQQIPRRHDSESPTTLEEAAIEKAMTHDVQLYRHELTRCFRTFKVVTAHDEETTSARKATPEEYDTINTHAPFNTRVQCYCIEKNATADTFNCLVRVRDALVFRSRDLAADIFVEGAPFSFQAQLDNSRETNDASESTATLWASKECKSPPSTNEDDKKSKMRSPTPPKLRSYIDYGDTDSIGRPFALRPCGWSHDFSLAKPYEAPMDFTDAPILFIPSVPYTSNSFHSNLGPGGVLQIVNTRAAINKFYHDMNGAIDEGHPEATEEGEVKRTPINNKYPPVRTPLVGRYQLNLSDPRVDGAPRASCSQTDFNAVHNPFDAAGASFEDEAAFARSVSIPPSYLAREMLFRNTLESGASPRLIGALSWFGRRMGFCLQEMPHTSYALTADLWINALRGPTGAVWRDTIRRPSTLVSPRNVSSVLLAEDYMNACPTWPEEAIAARYGAASMREMMETFADRHRNSKTVPPSPWASPVCLSVSRNVSGRQRNGDEKRMCVLVAGAPFDKSNGRGLPHNFEHAVLTALLMPDPYQSLGVSANSLAAGVATTSRSRSWFWDADAATQRRKCSDAVSPPSQKDHTIRSHCVATAQGQGVDGVKRLAICVDQINFAAVGRAPCESMAAPRELSYTSFTFAGDGGGIFDGSKLIRLDLNALGFVDQFQQIRGANVFIFEVGEPLMWAYNAPYGSTFIVVYNSNERRIDERGHRHLHFSPQIEKYFHFPALFGRVRMIFYVTHYGRMPGMSKLREAFDRPWKAESIVVACECDETRIAVYSEIAPKCPSARHD